MVDRPDAHDNIHSLIVQLREATCLLAKAVSGLSELTTIPLRVRMTGIIVFRRREVYLLERLLEAHLEGLNRAKRKYFQEVILNGADK